MHINKYIHASIDNKHLILTYMYHITWSRKCLGWVYIDGGLWILCNIKVLCRNTYKQTNGYNEYVYIYKFYIHPWVQNKWQLQKYMERFVDYKTCMLTRKSVILETDEINKVYTLKLVNINRACTLEVDTLATLSCDLKSSISSFCCVSFSFIPAKCSLIMLSWPS